MSASPSAAAGRAALATTVAALVPLAVSGPSVPPPAVVAIPIQVVLASVTPAATAAVPSEGKALTAVKGLTIWIPMAAGEAVQAKAVMLPLTVVPD
ncbi:MAG: hypothetical protein COT71_02270 [Candidatus Andersenbacteria bacterium CG10_big_fil_rev_8_21_14_0_10_54_11]|uniref:Uncharacterized protein n=1 Tax=Candidatus Andersenbacteria bacterium CG10_big_fil_rev_8_21_14_0_10_54_11 TaxID=1974485 RepID=A0A2M6WZG1_9BACT|nr:MAG: hypothetical protein COT71_02270 [Candidatus Andersenbacteria bacterium CG10_big_fil_rev_8_21_14_0_10_54_11]